MPKLVVRKMCGGFDCHCERKVASIESERFGTNDSVNVDEVICENVDAGEGDYGKALSVCPQLTHCSGVETSGKRMSSGNEEYRSLREESRGSQATSPLVRADWLLYSKRRRSSLEERDVLPANM